MNDWNRYGSPYDPSYSGRGKISRPQMRREPERYQRQICWCGDPNCTAFMDGRGRAPSSSPESIMGTYGERPTGSYSDFILEEGMRIISGFDAARPQLSSKSPPASYTAARKEVEKWLIPAPAQAFDDIVGNDAALEQLRDAIRAPVTHKELYEAYSMKMPKGAMLSGPPGCGKTMFARAAASEMKTLYGDGVEFVSIAGSELQSPFVGVTEGYIKSIFAFAREYQAHQGHPLLVFMDEAEVLLPDRTGRVRRVAQWEESQVATFLAEMDGIQESGAFVLLATNRPEVIDQAVLRDGRCDFKIVVERPTQAAIEVILRKGFTGKLVEGGDIEQLVFAATECFFDPGKIILDVQAVKVALNLASQDAEGAVTIADRAHRHFLLEHILSGAMAASIPARAIRYAFARDKADGIARGATVADVVCAVNDIFEENRKLDHSFALEQFRREFLRDVNRDRANAA